MKRRGFALPLVMGIMVVTFLIAASVLEVALTDLRASQGVHLSGRALLAAEAGAELTLADIETHQPLRLAAGDSVSTGWQELPGGARYRSTTLRIDDGISGYLAFRIATEGRSNGRWAARSRVVLVAACAPLTATLTEPVAPVVDPEPLSPGGRDTPSCAAPLRRGHASRVAELIELGHFRAP